MHDIHSKQRNDTGKIENTFRQEQPADDLQRMGVLFTKRPVGTISLAMPQQAHKTI